MNKAIFLDRDGVINVDKSYVHKLEDLEFHEGLENLGRLNDYKIFIVTNQSGIGRDYYTENDFKIFNNAILEHLDSLGIKVIETYYCPHNPDVNCNCRKPKPTSILEAKAKYDLDLLESWVVGDKASDVQLGVNAGCKTIFIQRQYDKKDSQPDYAVSSISDAVNCILRSDDEK